MKYFDHSSVSRELSRFFTVAAILQGQGVDVNMPAGYVDDHWHNLEQACGQKVLTDSLTGLRVAHVESAGTGELEWVSLYHLLFGELPEVWFRAKDGALDRAARADYLEKRVWRASWDCSPAILC